MLKEAANELFSRDGGEFDPVCRGLLVGEGNESILECNDAPVANGHPEDIRGEILEGSVAGTDRLAMDNPVFIPDLGADALKEIRPGEEIAELSPK